MKTTLYITLIFSVTISCSSLNTSQSHQSEMDKNVENLKKNQNNNIVDINYLNDWGKPKTK